MTRSTQVVAASVVTAIAIALFWLGAPIVPAVLGSCMAGLVLWWSKRGPMQTRAVCQAVDARVARPSPLREPQ